MIRINLLPVKAAQKKEMLKGQLMVVALVLIASVGVCSAAYMHIVGEVEDMHAAILDGEPNYLRLEETRNHIKTVLALLESAKTGKVIEL